MKAFREFVTEGKVQRQSADPAEARSLFQQARDRFTDICTLPLNEKNASFRFENTYECLREALQSFLSLAGYKPYSHEAVFSFASEKNILSESQASRADRYREIRNDINYRGKKVTVEETKEIIDFANYLLPFLENKFNAALKSASHET